MKYFIQTLGCAMNLSDSERVAAELEKLGHTRAQSGADADLYIFNTCSIRQKGEDRVFGKLDDLIVQKRLKSGLLVGLTGCMVRQTSTRNSPREVRDKLVRDKDSVDFVFRIEDSKNLGKILEEAAIKPKTVNDKVKRLRRNKGSAQSPQIFSDTRLDYLGIKPQYASPFQAFVPIQIGCDKYCTYCIVPYARGREQSRPMKEVLAECESLVENGCKEITLVGQTVNSYGRSDLDQKSGAFNNPYRGLPKEAASGKESANEPFVALLKEIDKLHAKGLNRLRFISPHPYDYTDALIKAHKDLKVLTPHFHIPIQSGSDETLKRMNRRYTAADYRLLIKKIRALIPDASVTTDIIVGFCGETKQDFNKSVKLFKEIKWDMAYLARYSPRPGTVSFRYFKDDVSHAEKARRWHALNKVLKKCARDYNKKLVGKTLEVLVEKYDKLTGEYEGRSRENKTVQFAAVVEKGLAKAKNSGTRLAGTLQEVKVTKALDWSLKGRREAPKGAERPKKIKNHNINPRNHAHPRIASK